MINIMNDMFWKFAYSAVDVPNALGHCIGGKKTVKYTCRLLDPYDDWDTTEDLKKDHYLLVQRFNDEL